METKQDFYKTLISKFQNLIDKHNLKDESVLVEGKVLTPEEALGKPDRRDFPLLSGKERLMDAEFRGCRGQAYTDMPGNFSGTLGDIVSRMPENNFQRAVLVSSINAVCRYLGLAEKTVHCRNNDPEKCADEINRFLNREYGSKIKIALVGHQPSMIDKLSGRFDLRNLDLDTDKIGTIRFGVEVEHGINALEEVLEWSDIILATGSTIVNSTIVKYLDRKPVYFYGTTIAGAAALLGLKRLCFCAA